MRRRAWWWAGGAGVVVLAVVVAVFLVRAGGDEPAAGGCRLVSPPAQAPAGDSTGVTIVEQGHDRVPSSSPEVSMGAVLHNTTDRVAYRTRVRFDILNAAGRSLVWPNHRTFMVHEVPIILPGARVAVGNALALTESARPDPDTVARISITPAVSQWLDPGDGNTGLGPVTATVVAGQGKRDADGTGSVAFTVTNANCAPMASRGSSMIFRDAAGTIVGGSLSTDLEPAACEPGPSGPDRVNSMLRSIPASADLDKTELTVYCDFNRPPRSTESGAPIN